jgi:hypothetical protein
MNQKTSREDVAEAIIVQGLLLRITILVEKNVYGKNIYGLVFEGDNSKEREKKIAAIVTAGKIDRLNSHLTD